MQRARAREARQGRPTRLSHPGRPFARCPTLPWVHMARFTSRARRNSEGNGRRETARARAPRKNVRYVRHRRRMERHDAPLCMPLERVRALFQRVRVPLCAINPAAAAAHARRASWRAWPCRAPDPCAACRARRVASRAPMLRCPRSRRACPQRQAPSRAPRTGVRARSERAAPACARTRTTPRTSSAVHARTVAPHACTARALPGRPHTRTRTRARAHVYHPDGMDVRRMVRTLIVTVKMTQKSSVGGGGSAVRQSMR